MADAAMSAARNPGPAGAAPARSPLRTAAAPLKPEAWRGAVGAVRGSGGRPLERGVQQEFGHRFGRDFSQVRVHTESAAAQSARQLRARAYALGPHIVFGAGQFAPGTPQGRRLLAHELAHVVQGAPIVARATTDAGGAQIQTRRPSAQAAERLAAVESVDPLIAQRQAATEEGAARLGTLDLAGVPATELEAVKRQIVLYFDLGTRNAEVDVWVWIADPGSTVFYTLRFDAEGNVTALRLGEKGDNPLLDPSKPSIARAAGYAARNPQELRKWLAQRYPALPIEGETVQEITDGADAALRKCVCHASMVRRQLWPEGLYPRRSRRHGCAPLSVTPNQQLVGVTDFDETDLNALELAIEAMAQPILSVLAGTRLGRQDVDRLELVDGQVGAVA